MKKIGIIAAMWVELEPIHSNMSEIKEYVISGMKYFEGKIDGIQVVLSECGIGKINAAIYTQILIDRFKVDAIIHTGIAGSMDNVVKHLGIVVAEGLTYHDIRKTQMKNFFPFQSEFKTDKKISSILAASAGNDCVKGLIISGDAFITDTKRKDNLKKLYPNAACVEMEGCAVAHAAFVNNIPFGVIRCISDLADGNASEDYFDFEKVAAKKAGEIVIKSIKKLVYQEI